MTNVVGFEDPILHTLKALAVNESEIGECRRGGGTLGNEPGRGSVMGDKEPQWFIVDGMGEVGMHLVILKL